MLGSLKPFSNKLMTPLLTPSILADSVCPKPFSKRSFFIFKLVRVFHNNIFIANATEILDFFKIILYISNKRRKCFMDGKNAVRFFLTFFLGFIGSFIINHTSLTPVGWRSRTCAYFFLGIITFGIYGLVASICNFMFDDARPSNIGYFRY